MDIDLFNISRQKDFFFTQKISEQINIGRSLVYECGRYFLTSARENRWSWSAHPRGEPETKLAVLRKDC